MDTVRQTEEARVRQNSSERDAERDTEAERPRHEQSDGRKHRGRGTVLCGEGSRDRSRDTHRRETEKLRDRHTVRDTQRNRDPERHSQTEIRRPADRQNLTEPGTHAEIKKPTDREAKAETQSSPRRGKKNAATWGRETASPQHLPENTSIFFFFLHLCYLFFYQRKIALQNFIVFFLFCIYVLF